MRGASVDGDFVFLVILYRKQPTVLILSALAALVTPSRKASAKPTESVAFPALPTVT